MIKTKADIELVKDLHKATVRYDSTGVEPVELEGPNFETLDKATN